MARFNPAVGDDDFVAVFRARRIDAVFDHVRLRRVSGTLDFKLENGGHGCLVWGYGCMGVWV